jgi:hypothetical protein
MMPGRIQASRKSFQEKVLDLTDEIGVKSPPPLEAAFPR